VLLLLFTDKVVLNDGGDNSSETSIPTTVTRRHITQDGTLYSLVDVSEENIFPIICAEE
jgi:hypothetical protein